MKQGVPEEPRKTKENMVATPIWVFPKWKKEFHVHVDALSVELGVILAQPVEVSIDHPIMFVIQKLSTTEKNYTTTKEEGLEMGYALQKFHHNLLEGAFKMFIEHSTLKYLVNNPLFMGIYVSSFYCYKNSTLKLLWNPNVWM